MNELTQKLWPAFQAEVSEQLEAIELALVKQGAREQVDVNALFRHFHTVKGGCAMMGFANMGAVAHASEDVLDPVRKGRRVFDDTLVDALLQALDALKQQMDHASRTRQDPPPRDDVVAKLRAEAASNAPAAVETPAGKPPLPKGRRGKAGEAVPPMPATADARDSRPFADVCRERLPGLIDRSLAPAATPAGESADILHLQDAAAAAGVAAVAQLLSKLAQEPADRAARLLLLGDLVERIAWFESTSGLDCGTAMTASRLRTSHRGAIAEAVAALSEAIAPLMSPGGASRAREIAEQALGQTAAVLGLAQVLALPRTARLMRAAAQVLREVARGAVSLSHELADLLLVAASLPAELHDGIEEDAPYDAMCSQVLERLQAVAASLTRGSDLEARCQRVAGRVGIRPDVLDTLLLPAVELLEGALDRDDTVFEVEADLESAPDSGEAFVAWLSRIGTIISNHTVFYRETTGGTHRQSTRLRFLASSRAPLSEIRQALGDMDPDHRLFDLQVCERKGEAAATPASAAVAATKPAVATGATTAAGSASTLRIDSATLDRFVNRVGEMVMLRNMMAHALGGEDDTVRFRRLRGLLGNRTASTPLTDAELSDLRTLFDELDARHERLAQTDLRVQGALGRMQEDVLALRVVPIGLVFNRFPRVVRDISQSQRKQVNIEISGEDVRIDKSLVDVLSEPLLHLVRNAIDHGIEDAPARQAAGKPATATLSLTARQQGNTLQVEVSDDGRGIDTARIGAKAVASGVASASDVAGMSEREIFNLIFLPGFSTADQVTEVSGRGVGMDVVRTRIVQVGGQVEVRSQPGRGATFILRLPLSAAIQSVILVASGERQLAIPDRNVTEVISLPSSSLQSVQGQACCLLRGANLPLYHLGQLLGDTTAPARTGELLEVIVLTDGTWQIGVIVDRVLGRPEVFVRDIHPDLARVPGVGGASILGDGRVVIIVDTDNLFELALRNAQSLRSLLRAS